MTENVYALYRDGIAEIMRSLFLIITFRVDSDADAPSVEELQGVARHGTDKIGAINDLFRDE